MEKIISWESVPQNCSYNFFIESFCPSAKAENFPSVICNSPVVYDECSIHIVK